MMDFHCIHTGKAFVDATNTTTAINSKTSKNFLTNTDFHIKNGVQHSNNNIDSQSTKRKRSSSMGGRFTLPPSLTVIPMQSAAAEARQPGSTQISLREIVTKKKSSVNGGSTIERINERECRLKHQQILHRFQSQREPEEDSRTNHIIRPRKQHRSISPSRRYLTEAGTQNHQRKFRGSVNIIVKTKCNYCSNETSSTNASSLVLTNKSNTISSQLQPPLWTNQFASFVTKQIQEGSCLPSSPRRISLPKNTKTAAGTTTFLENFNPQHILLNDTLGSGTFSNVTKVTIIKKRNPKKAQYALKSLKRDLLPKVLPGGTCKGALVSNAIAAFIRAAKELTTEAYLLSKLDHKHIVSIKGWTANGIASFEEYKRHDAFFLVLELLHEENLERRIDRWNKEDSRMMNNTNTTTTMSTKHRINYERRIEQLSICSQIANALDYIHSKNIIYRDLKPANIGFVIKSSDDRDKGNDDNCNGIHVIKLMDFGLARELPHQERRRGLEYDNRDSSVSSPNRVFNMTGTVGTMRYMAPEVAVNQRYNAKADIYSWSIVAYEILSQTCPFDNMSPEEYQTIVCKQGLRPNSWNEEQKEYHRHELPSECLVLLANAWRADSSKRLPLNRIQMQIVLFIEKERLLLEAEQLLSNMPDSN